MIELVPVTLRGEARVAIRCYGPSQYDYIERKRNVDSITIKDGWKPPRMLVVLPKGVDAVMMNRVVAALVSSPAFTVPRKIRFHPNTYYVTLLLVLHELIHAYRQAQKMHDGGFWATFLWQLFPIAFIKSGFHWHDEHVMEEEARLVSNRICSMLTPEMELLLFDAAAVIDAQFPDWRAAA